ncbi:SAM-dependent methyltransferase [Balamuthia mandrillaris]
MEETAGGEHGDVHRVAAAGFGAEADEYERSRPSYPVVAVRYVVETLRLSPQSIVCELGAGTGKFTRQLLEECGCTIHAVEPVAEMRAKLSSQVPQVTVSAGSAAAIPLDDESVDAIVIAQAFHWFANLTSLKEMHRVLKQGGKVALIWNLEDRSASPWVAKLRDLYESYEVGTPQYRLGLWRKVFEEEESKEEVQKMFALPLSHKQFSQVMRCDKQKIWGRILSKSYIASLDSQQKEELRQKVMQLLEENIPEFAKESSATEEVSYPYLTDVFWFQKK